MSDLYSVSSKLKFVLQMVLLGFLLVGSGSLTAKVDVKEQQKLLEKLNAGEIPQFAPTESHPKASKQIIREITDLHYRKPLRRKKQ